MQLRPALTRRRIAALLCAAATFAVGTRARADLSAVLANRDRFTGTLSPGTEIDVFAVACPAQAVLMVTVAATKVADAKTAYPVRVRVLGAGGAPLQDADRPGSLRVADATGTKVVFRHVAVPATGAYRIEIRSGAGDAKRDVGYTATAAWTGRAKWNVRDLATVPGSPGLLRFSASAGAVVKFAAKAPGGVAPTFGRVLENGAATGVDLTGAARKDLRFAVPHDGDFDVEVVAPTSAVVNATATVAPPKPYPGRFDVSNVRMQAAVFRIDPTKPALLDPGIAGIAGFRASIPVGTFPAGTSVVVGPADAIGSSGPFVQAGPGVSITASQKFRAGSTVDLTLPFDPAAARGDAANLAVLVRTDKGDVSTLTSGFTTDLLAGSATLPASHFSTYQMAAKSLTGTIATVVGNGTPTYAGDGGPAIAASIRFPLDVAVDTAGNLYIADDHNLRIRKVDALGTITTIAGTGAAGHFGDGGPATAATIDSPHGVAVDAAGNVYVAVYDGNRVQKIDLAGTITTVAGTGTNDYTGDGGPATAATLWSPVGVAVDASGNLFIADYFNHVVRKVDSSGRITTVAGDGSNSFSGDGGPATAASLNNPDAVAVDAAGNLYVADGPGHRVRKVDSNGTITTFAGNGSATSSGDGGPAAAASIITPRSVAVDTSGNVYIADIDGFVVRKVDAAGTITTFAGNGTAGLSADGVQATAASIDGLSGIAVDAFGSVYITDSTNDRIRRIVR